MLLLPLFDQHFATPEGRDSSYTFRVFSPAFDADPGQWHKNHHNFYLQALQSTAVTILKSEEYCYEKHQPNADRCMAGTTETF